MASLKINQNQWTLGQNSLESKFEKIEKNLPTEAANIMAAAAAEFNQLLRGNLSGQGRSPQSPPPLSSATKTIYSHTQGGGPSGSGIVNHIEIVYRRRSASFVAIVGIPQGRPTTVARVQNYGALIQVTDRMRGFLAAHGIYLRRDTSHIRVPPRDFWRLAVRDSRRNTRRRCRGLIRKITQ